MSVHIFEAVGFAVRRRHQFDDPFARMRGEARCLLEYVPAPVIGVDRVGAIDENPLDPEMVYQSHHILDAYEWNNGERGGGRKSVETRVGKEELSKCRIGWTRSSQTKKWITMNE